MRWVAALGLVIVVAGCAAPSEGPGGASLAHSRETPILVQDDGHWTLPTKPLKLVPEFVFDRVSDPAGRSVALLANSTGIWCVWSAQPWVAGIEPNDMAVSCAMGGVTRISRQWQGALLLAPGLPDGAMFAEVLVHTQYPGQPAEARPIVPGHAYLSGTTLAKVATTWNPEPVFCPWTPYPQERVLEGPRTMAVPVSWEAHNGAMELQVDVGPSEVTDVDGGVANVSVAVDGGVVTIRSLLPFSRFEGRLTVRPIAGEADEAEGPACGLGMKHDAQDWTLTTRWTSLAGEVTSASQVQRVDVWNWPA